MALENCSVTQVVLEGNEGETQLSGYVDLLITPLNGTTVSASELFIGSGPAIVSNPVGTNIWIGGNVTNGVTQVEFIDNPDGTVTARVSYDTFIFGQLNNLNELRIDIDRVRPKDPIDPPPPPPPPPVIQEEILKAKIWDVVVADEDHENLIVIEDEYSSYSEPSLPLDDSYLDGFRINAAQTTLHPEYNQVSTIPGLSEELDNVQANKDYIITKRTLVDKIPYKPGGNRNMMDSITTRRNRFLRRKVKISQEGLEQGRYFLEVFGCGAPFKDNPFINGDTTGPNWTDQYQALGIFSMAKLQRPFAFAGIQENMKYNNLTWVVFFDEDKEYDEEGRLISFVAEYYYFPSRTGLQVANLYTNPGVFANSLVLNPDNFSIYQSHLDNLSEENLQAFLNGEWSDDYRFNEPVYWPNLFDGNFLNIPLDVPDDFPLEHFPSALTQQEPTSNMGGGLLCLLAYRLNRVNKIVLAGSKPLDDALPRERTVNSVKKEFENVHHFGGINNVVVDADPGAVFDVEVVDEKTRNSYDFDKKTFEKGLNKKTFTATRRFTSIPIEVPSSSNFVQEGATSRDSFEVTLSAANSRIKNGMIVKGTHVPVGTKVSSYSGGTTLVLDTQTTNAATSDLTFTPDTKYLVNVTASSNPADNTKLSESVKQISFGLLKKVDINVKFKSTNNDTFYTIPSPELIVNAIAGSTYKKIAGFNAVDSRAKAALYPNVFAYQVNIPYVAGGGKTTATAKENFNNIRPTIEQYDLNKDNPKSGVNPAEYLFSFTNYLTSIVVNTGDSRVEITGEIEIDNIPLQPANVLIDLDNLFTVS